MASTTTPKARRKRSDGERSRRAILDASARLATVEGLDGLSIGRLAEHIGMSKSGLYAHFDSKEELQLATVETAAAIYEAEVTGPAREAPPGLARLRALVDNFISHVERGVFPGGCFFASAGAELDMRPGPVRRAVKEITDEWFGELESAVREAQAAGEIARDGDATQVAFEVDAMLLLGNATFLMDPELEGFGRSRRGIDRVLGV